MGAKIVVAVDGSPHAARAITWCVENAPALDAEVVVVHSMEPPKYTGIGPSYIWVRHAGVERQQARRERVTRDWCAPLVAARVPFRVEVVDGDPAEAVARVAREEGAELVVTGRRGIGAVREHLLGSTSHELTHLLDVPLVIVP
jgi:nucleotide-binding universal stress UspA family protein